jgi:hypothetical protein
MMWKRPRAASCAGTGHEALSTTNCGRIAKNPLSRPGRCRICSSALSADAGLAAMRGPALRLSVRGWGARGVDVGVAVAVAGVGAPHADLGVPAARAGDRRPRTGPDHRDRGIGRARQHGARGGRGADALRRRTPDAPRLRLASVGLTSANEPASMAKPAERVGVSGAG